MMNILCVYCTRSGLTERAARHIAEKTNAECLKITDGKSRKGILGYIAACITTLSGILPKLEAYNTKLPISEYDKIIVAAPIWCEDICPMAKAFLKQNAAEIKGEIYFVATHMSALSYEEKIISLSRYAGRKISKIFSLKTKKNDFIKELDSLFESEK